MTTLIRQVTGGTVDGQCDAKCHGAREPECDCICGGKNHGVGGAKAAENTREMAEELVQRTGATARVPLF